MKSMVRHFRAAGRSPARAARLLLLVAAMPLAACGIKGPLKPAPAVAPPPVERAVVPAPRAPAPEQPAPPPVEPSRAPRS